MFADKAPNGFNCYKSYIVSVNTQINSYFLINYYCAIIGCWMSDEFPDRCSYVTNKEIIGVIIKISYHKLRFMRDAIKKFPNLLYPEGVLHFLAHLRFTISKTQSLVSLKYYSNTNLELIVDNFVLLLGTIRIRKVVRSRYI